MYRTNYCRKVAASEVTGAVRLFLDMPESVILTYVDAHTTADLFHTVRAALVDQIR